MATRESKFPVSRSSRFLKLSALSGKVGSSYLGEAVKGAFLDAESKARSLLDTNTQNALRVARTFGELKGAVMKVGQMMSLQEDMLPPEMREILRGLQKQAPPVQFERLLSVLQTELGSDLDVHFAEISKHAYASASIGQVHRGKLKDGREVVIKIQYPKVDTTVDSDLKNLRMFVLSFKKVLPLKANVDELFQEARARLTEELDYRLELMNMIEFRELFKNDERFIIPAPVRKLSTRRVLTTEFYPGLSADALCAEDVPQERRDIAGANLADAALTQFFAFHTLQADPNLANFSFTEDDRVIMYDFGCVKRFPAAFVEGIRRLAADALKGDYDRLPGDLEALGVVDLGRQRLPVDVYRIYADTAFSELRGPGLYDFATTDLHKQIIDLDRKYWAKAFDFDVPADAIFMWRTLVGMYGNLRKLQARVPMRALAEKHLQLDKNM